MSVRSLVRSFVRLLVARLNQRHNLISSMKPNKRARAKISAPSSSIVNRDEMKFNYGKVDDVAEDPPAAIFI
jgi:hypothetical protein